MAESKRIFNRGKMNRDLDDRLVPEGEYRDALNVNIGRSEGSDVGAVENLKGNEQISSVEPGTTLGVVRDPNNNRVYWFNTSPTVDAIYEYDLDTNMVNPILLDQVSNPFAQPTCNPVFRIPEQNIPSDQGDRPELDDFPPSPQGYCSIAGRPNSNERADRTPFNPAIDFPMDSICEDEVVIQPGALGVTVANVTGQVGDGDLTLTAVPSGAEPNDAAVTYHWSLTNDFTGTPLSTTSTLTVTDPDDGVGGTFTRFVQVDTPTQTAASGSGDAIFTVDPPFDYTFSHSGSFTGATLQTASALTQSGVDPLAVDFTSEQVLADNMQWTATGIPTATFTNPDGLTATQTTGASQTDNLFARLTGSVSAAGSASITWTGGETEMIVIPTAFVFALSPGNASSGLGRMNFIFVTTANNVETAPTAAAITFTGTINGNPITATTVPTGPSIANPNQSLSVTFSGFWEAAGINDGGGFGVAAGSNTVIITGITLSFTGGSIAAPTPILPFIETRIGVTGATHTAFPATLVTP